MQSRFSGYRWVPFVFWVLAFAAIPVWNASFPGLDNDAKIYLNTIHSIHAGHDPYADGIATTTAFHNQPVQSPNAQPLNPYIYSPITLPLLRLIGSFPTALYIWGYWLIYAAGALAQIWVGMQATEPKERRVFVFLAPAAPFFPGLLQTSTLMCGNIAYILYGLVFVAAFLGWRRGRWHWFYLAVLAASCCKIQLLSLLAISILSTRKQWLPACTTAFAGVALFVMQAWLWPSYFHNYLHVIELQLSYNHDFGSSLAGLYSMILLNAGLPYSTASMIFYILYALLILGVLLYLSRKFLGGKFPLKQWIPVMVTGVILLNPRIQEYDYAPVTLFMALILWRCMASLTSPARAIISSFLFFAIVNVIAVLIAPIDTSSFYLKCIQCFLLAGAFAAGCWNLLRQTRESAISAGIPSTIG
jgi:hypothetical protein